MIERMVDRGRNLIGRRKSNKLIISLLLLLAIVFVELEHNNNDGYGRKGHRRRIPGNFQKVLVGVTKLLLYLL